MSVQLNSIFHFLERERLKWIHPKAEKKRKILIVDDESAFGRMVKLNLEKSGGYEVLVETDGRNTCASVRVFCPDLIFLDVVMSEISGEEVMQQLMAAGDIKHIPVVFLTATVGCDEINSHGSILSRYPVLTKPVTVDGILECIRQNIRT